LILRTKGPTTNAVLFTSTFTPSSQVAEILILVFPNPRMNPAFMSSKPFSKVIDGTVPVVVFPRKINFPSRVIVQMTFVAFASPMFFTDVLMPNPPVISPISRIGNSGGSVMVAVVVLVAVSEDASVTVNETL